MGIRKATQLFKKLLKVTHMIVNSLWDADSFVLYFRDLDNSLLLCWYFVRFVTCERDSDDFLLEVLYCTGLSPGAWDGDDLVLIRLLSDCFVMVLSTGNCFVSAQE